MRTFESGATRDDDEKKLDYDGFLSPLVIRRYAEYLHKHRTQADGKLRNSDQWQKGIPLATYMKSMWRHFVDLWTLHRGIPIKDQILGPVVSEEADRIVVTKEEALCAVIFNASGYLHELLKKEWDNIPDGTSIPINQKECHSTPPFEDFRPPSEDF